MTSDDCECPPHQVYGPRDNLFLPNLLEAAGTGRLRVFGKGFNRICFTHVDNYCHGLIIAERALKKNSPALGKFYITTDGRTHPNDEQYLIFWKELDKAVVGMGFTSLWDKTHLATWFLTPSRICAEASRSSCAQLLNPFNVRVSTMPPWSTRQRQRDLGFEHHSLRTGPLTITWSGSTGCRSSTPGQRIGASPRSQAKIDIQDARDDPKKWGAKADSH